MSADQYTATGGVVLDARDHGTEVHLWGEVDEMLRLQATDVLSEVLYRDRPVVVDGRRVTFLGSAGVAFLTQLCEAVHEEGLRVTLREPSAALLDVLDLLGVLGAFDAVE